MVITWLCDFLWLIDNIIKIIFSMALTSFSKRVFLKLPEADNIVNNNIKRRTL